MGERAQPSDLNCIGGVEGLDGDRAIDEASAGELRGDLSRIGVTGGDVAQRLGEVDGGHRGTGGDRIGDRVGAGLIGEVGEQRRGIEHRPGGPFSRLRSPLLLVLRLGTALGEQLLDKRALLDQIGEQSATLLRNDSIGTQAQRAIVFSTQKHSRAALKPQGRANRGRQHQAAAISQSHLLVVGHL